MYKMSGETNGLLESYSHEKYPLEKETIEPKDATQLHPRTWAARNKIARWTLVVLVAITLTLWSHGSNVPLGIDQRVDQILSENPLVGRKRSLICRNVPSSDH